MGVPFVDGQLVTETLIAFAMIAMLGLILRWTFSHNRDTESRLWPPGPDDFGLLAPVATVDTADEATRLRTALSLAGVKATTTITRDGRHQILVFANDLDRARRVAN